MKARIKEYGILVPALVLLIAALSIHPLSGEEVVEFPWKTLAFLFMLLLTQEGLRKEKIALPVMRVLNSVRSTPFMFFLLFASTFLLSLFLFPSMTVSMMVPFTLRLLKESRKEKYTLHALSLMTVLIGITTLLTPFSPANLFLFLDAEAHYTSYMTSLLIPFALSLVIFLIEAFLLLRKTRGDEIYLHIEDEDYWERERRGMRVFHSAFFLVVLFGRRFNTIDLLLIVLLAYLIFDRKIFSSIQWPVFLTLALSLLAGYTLGKDGWGENGWLTLLSSVFITRAGGNAMGGKTAYTLPSLFLSLPITLLFTVREMKMGRKEFIREYILLSLPHTLLYLLLFIFSL